MQALKLQHQPSLEALLDREVDQFDRLMSEVRAGIAGPAQYDALEERIDGIASRMRAAFRAGRGQGGKACRSI